MTIANIGLVREMRTNLVIAAILGVVIVVGVGAYGLTAPGVIPTTVSTTSQSSQSQSVTTQASPGSNTYYCAKPAISSQYICDQLPPGYVVAPRLPNAPQPFCYSQMSASACALFKKTFVNGVCDPNETAFTDPLDCGCSGVVIADPYTGRCAAPASICQIVGVPQPQPAG